MNDIILNNKYKKYEYLTNKHPYNELYKHKLQKYNILKQNGGNNRGSDKTNQLIKKIYNIITNIKQYNNEYYNIQGGAEFEADEDPFAKQKEYISKMRKENDKYIEEYEKNIDDMKQKQKEMNDTIMRRFEKLLAQNKTIEAQLAINKQELEKQNSEIKSRDTDIVNCINNYDKYVTNTNLKLPPMLVIKGPGLNDLKNKYESLLKK